MVIGQPHGGTARTLSIDYEEPIIDEPQFSYTLSTQIGSSWHTFILAKDETWSVRYELLSSRKFPINGQEDQTEFLDSFYRPHGEGVLAKGLKAAPFQIIDKPAVVNFLNSPEILVICLTRRNSGKAAVSAIRADKLRMESIENGGSGRTNLRDSESVQLATVISTDRFVEELRRLETKRHSVHFMRRSLVWTIDISYEELCDDPPKIKTQIEDALGVLLPVLGGGGIKKKTPDNLSEAISNYREIAECLQSSKYRELLER